MYRKHQELNNELEHIYKLQEIEIINDVVGGFNKRSQRDAYISKKYQNNELFNDCLLQMSSTFTSAAISSSNELFDIIQQRGEKERIKLENEKKEYLKRTKARFMQIGNHSIYINKYIIYCKFIF